MKFKNNIEVQAGLKDSSGSIGLSSQVLSSNGTNVTWVSLSSSIGGTGTTNYISKFTSASTIGNSQIFDNGTNVGIGTTSPGAKLDVVGKIALNDGGNSVFVGTDAGLNDDASDNSNVGIGYQSLLSNTTGSGNTANGYQSLFSNTTGINNTANGLNSLYSNTTGVNNTASGYQSLRFNTTGPNNTANGYRSLYSNTTGTGNTAYGLNSLYSNTTGGNNIGLGFSSARHIADGVTANTITNNSVFLGASTKALANNQTNQIVIGYDATGLGSNTVVLGNDSIITTALKGNVGIGTTAPSQLLHIETATTTARILTKTTVAGNHTASHQIVCNDSDMLFGAANDAYVAVPEYSGKTFIQGNGGSLAVVAQSNDLEFYAGGRNSGNKRMIVKASGNIGVGTTSPNASAIMDLTSTTQGFLPPRITTVQRNAISSPTEGLMIFNITAKTMDVYDGTAWKSLRYI